MLDSSYTDFSRFYKRKLRYNLVSDGQNAFIGAVHRLAANRESA